MVDLLIAGLSRMDLIYELVAVVCVLRREGLGFLVHRSAAAAAKYL